MKSFLVLVIMCIGYSVGLGQTILANPPEGEGEDALIIPASKYHLWVGPTVGFAAAGINTNNAEGRKVNPDFWPLPSYGVVINAPFSRFSRLGGRVEFGVNTLGTRTRPYETYNRQVSWNANIHERYTYFTIAPQFNLSGLLLGVGINIPMKGEMWDPLRPNDKFVVDRTTLKTALDFRIGGTVALWSTDFGTLYSDISVRYVFSGIYEPNKYAFGGPVDEYGVANFATTQTASHIEFIPVSAQFGITYLFDIKL
jgi:hypothetical protein